MSAQKKFVKKVQWLTFYHDLKVMCHLSWAQKIIHKMRKLGIEWNICVLKSKVRGKLKIFCRLKIQSKNKKFTFQTFFTSLCARHIIIVLQSGKVFFFVTFNSLTTVIKRNEIYFSTRKWWKQQQQTIIKGRKLSTSHLVSLCIISNFIWELFAY
jgi:hypothetical protein